MNGCVFCDIISGKASACKVLENEDVCAFLDIRPLFPGHVLVAPKQHHETLPELPPDQVEPLFSAARLVCACVERALDAQGTFVAINNRVSQSVPHLHVHVVPRKFRDGLKGFFWPRNPYRDEAHREQVRARIAEEVKRRVGG